MHPSKLGDETGMTNSVFETVFYLEIKIWKYILVEVFQKIYPSTSDGIFFKTLFSKRLFMLFNAVQDYEDAKDFEQFLIVKSIIENEFSDWTKKSLLSVLESIYKNWSGFYKNNQLMEVLNWREMLKNW